MHLQNKLDSLETLFSNRFSYRSSHHVLKKKQKTKEFSFNPCFLKLHSLTVSYNDIPCWITMLLSNRKKERKKKGGENPIIEYAYWRMTIQKGAARMEMPFASILNSLLPRVRSRSRAFVVCVSMMKYHRVGHPLPLSFLSFHPAWGKEARIRPRSSDWSPDFSTRRIVAGLDKRWKVWFD